MGKLYIKKNCKGDAVCCDYYHHRLQGMVGFWIKMWFDLLMEHHKIPQTIFQLFHVFVVFIIHITQFLRPTRSSYIRIYDGNGTEVIRLNAATSPAVTFPQTSQGRELTFRTTNFTFTAKRSYYVLFDPGGYMCIKRRSLYFAIR